MRKRLMSRAGLWCLMTIGAIAVLGFEAFNPRTNNPAVEPSSPPRGIDSAAVSPVSLGSYIWPTDASTRITSSFAEYRTMHFHGGIDISTNGTKGYKVLSVNDGYVCRIRIQPNGYGKMLFIKHPDGYISTYAHLMGFNAEITKQMRREQYRRGTYAIDLTLDSLAIPVKKGDIVALTGDTGFGPPHLHFEMRDRDLNPVNPFLVCKYPNEDNVAPRFERLMVTPLGFNSTVDNSPSSKVFRRFPRASGELSVPGKLTLHGTIGFELLVHDRAGGYRDRAGIHSLQFFLDDSLAYSMTLDRVPADESKQIYLHYDYPTLLQGWGQFQKLYVETGTTLPIYNGNPEGSGIINTESLHWGDHQYRIVCEDYAGNTSTLHGTLLVNHTPEIALSHIDDEDIVLTGKDLSLIAKCTVYGKKLYGQNWSQHTFSTSRLERDNDGIEIPFKTKDYDILKVVAETQWGSHTPPLFHFNRKPVESVRSVSIKTEVHDDYVRFTLTSAGMFTQKPKVILQEGSRQRSIEVEPVDEYKYTGAYVPVSPFAGPRILTVQAEINGKPTTASDAEEMYSIDPRTSGSFIAPSTQLRFSYDSAAVFKPLHMQVSTENDRRSKIYILEPEDQIINRGIRVSVPIGGDAQENHRALYFRSNGGWIFLTAKPDSTGRSFSSTLRTTLGELAIMQDNEQPRLGRLRLSARKGKVSFSIRYSDNLSGVDADEIKMYIDDAPVIPEIDGEHHQVWFASEEPLARGKHSLKISVKDRMKNETVASRTFSVR